ncbi:hypothetical protein WN51_04862 [Melipona quadrifasciata]|uniref:Uncharacterized protein n=1 Tax=Melipona quadrifasciata TaxID=166423 RepID=A0A0N0BDG2_9HYME|nr:hypothetical protein WN51_04862 [Melipona quadrifasciata]
MVVSAKLLSLRKFVRNSSNSKQRNYSGCKIEDKTVEDKNDFSVGNPENQASSGATLMQRKLAIEATKYLVQKTIVIVHAIQDDCSYVVTMLVATSASYEYYKWATNVLHMSDLQQDYST